MNCNIMGVVDMEEGKVLAALQMYYLGDITFERVAEEAGITIYELIEYFKKHELPIIHTEKDVADGIKKLDELMERCGMKRILAR